jgi:hypothetical protein
MRVLDGLADWNEQPDAFTHSQALRIAVARDRDPIDQLHHEVGATLRSGTSTKTWAMFG